MRQRHRQRPVFSDADTIRQWWDRWPYCNIGLAANGFFVLDVDSGTGGYESLEKLVERNPGWHDPRTFGEFFDEWMRKHCERNCEPTTVEGYAKKGVYAKQHFGEVPLAKLTPLQIETALNALSDHGGMKTAQHPHGRPLSAKTVREVAAVVNATFNAAIRWGAIDLNPMVRVTLPRMQKREPKVLEKSQIEWFLTGVDGHEWLHALLLLDAATGCRRGELLALQWPDIDFEMAVLSVTKSLAQTQAKGVFLKLPKGRKVRRFSLPASALDVKL